MNNDARLFRKTLRAALTSLNIACDDAQLEQLYAHYRAMCAVNRVMNLTRITDPEEAAVKHYADSLAVIPWLEEQSERISCVLDIGTGAGFPAIPLAVLCPFLQITAIDGTAKKIAFVRDVCAELHLGNVETQHAHSSQFRPPQPFDLVLTRAVGSLQKCLEASARHVRPGGFIVAYKTPSVADELERVRSVFRKEDLLALAPYPYTLPLRDERLSRLLIPFRRIGP